MDSAGPKKHELDEVRAHWRKMKNMIEPFVCGGDAAFFSNYFDHLLITIF